jgi:hypothetical protein
MEKQLSSSYWHELAGQARVRAETIREAEVKRILLQIADGYDAMATRIEAVDPFREGSVVNGKLPRNGE